MATWSALRQRLASVSGSLTMSWSELDDLVGGLPPAAYRYQAFWSGGRPAWAGFRTTAVKVGHSVTFIRHSPASTTNARTSPIDTKLPVDIGTSGRPRRADGINAHSDVVLVGCVKQKLASATAARDMYTSPLFRKARAYAESSGARWLILSAQHGVVQPHATLAPYDLQLSKTPIAYRRSWGARVLNQLHGALGELSGLAIEIHAGSAYIDPIRSGLRAAGAHLSEPLAGLALGERLAWYGRRADPAPLTALDTGPVASPKAVVELVSVLGDDTAAMTVASFLATGGVGLARPGLYSWWVDADGAADLTVGLGQHLAPGLLYAGLAGATRTGGRRSTNTLWGRIRTMHLGGNHNFSTLRLTLGSILAEARGETAIDEASLTTWMTEHLQLVVVPVDDRDALDALETGVLASLDPPLNLSRMPRTPIRCRLTDLRRVHT